MSEQRSNIDHKTMTETGLVYNSCLFPNCNNESWIDAITGLVYYACNKHFNEFGIRVCVASSCNNPCHQDSLLKVTYSYCSIHFLGWLGVDPICLNRAPAKQTHPVQIQEISNTVSKQMSLTTLLNTPEKKLEEKSDNKIKDIQLLSDNTNFPIKTITKQKKNKRGWNKLTNALLEEMLEYEKKHLNVTVSDLQKRFNVNRTTFSRRKKEHLEYMKSIEKYNRPK